VICLDRQDGISPSSALKGCRLRGKDGNSSCETAMPGRENVFGGVDITAVSRTAFAANPLFRRISDLLPRPFRPFGPVRLVQPLQIWVEYASLTSSNQTPARSICTAAWFGMRSSPRPEAIWPGSFSEERRHSRYRRRWHHRLERAGAEFVTKVLTPVCHLCVDCLDPVFLISALRGRQRNHASTCSRVTSRGRTAGTSWTNFF
jgi:hypothetical protein